MLLTLFSLYLLIIVIKGCFKFGVRFFCFSIHPMKYNGTLMNSFLFNLVLLMICSLPVMQFITEAFREYAHSTDVSAIFGTQIRYMKFFQNFFDKRVFNYALFSVSGLSVIYLLLFPVDVQAHKAKEMQVRVEQLKSKSGSRV